METEKETGKNQRAEAYWQTFLAATGRDENLRWFECSHFDPTEEWAEKLLALVLAGKKRATAGSLH